MRLRRGLARGVVARYAREMHSHLGTLLEPFSATELAKAAGESVTRQEFGRWKNGSRIPASGPSIRILAAALLDCREADGIPTGDLPAVIAEITAAVRADRTTRRQETPRRR